MKNSLTEKGKIILGAIAVLLVCIGLGFFFKKINATGPAPKTMTKKQVEAVLDEKLDRSFDSLTMQISAQKESIYAQQKTIEEMIAAGQKQSAAMLAVANSLKKYGAALDGTTYLETTTKMDSVLARVTGDSANLVAMLDALDQAARRLNAINPPPITWTQANEWANQTFTYEPKDRSGYFNLFVKNKFTINRFEKDGKAFIEILNANPFTYTDEGTNHFEIAPADNTTNVSRKKRFGFGFQAGGGIDKNLKPTPYLGVGLSYNIWNL